MAVENCEICAESQFKYKCVCTLRYCSVKCYRKHKSANDQEAISCKPPLKTPVKDIDSRQATASELPKRDFPREDMVPPRLLEYLQGSRGLRSILANPHLRELLTTLASQSDPARMLDHLMQEPIFIEFADRCMEVIDPPE